MAAAIQTNARGFWVMREETGNPGHRQPRNKIQVRGPEFTVVREERLIPLRRWKTDGHFHDRAAMVREAIKALATSDSKEAEAALALVAEIGARKTTPDATSAAFRQACIVSIKSAENPDLKPGSPPNRPRLAWDALRWLIQQETADLSLVPADWKEAFALMESRFPLAGPPEKEAMCGLFNAFNWNPGFCWCFAMRSNG